MGDGSAGVRALWLTIFCCLLPSLAQGLMILDPGEVQYRHIQTKGIVGRSVMLECGQTLPNIFIWGFTKPGTESIKAVVYNYGQGPKLQKLASSLGDLSVISDSASLVFDNLKQSAEGLYTCQALHETSTETKLTYFYIDLLVLVPISKPFIQLSESSPVENAPLWMVCAVENGTGPINFVWERQGRDGVSVRVSESNSSLMNLTVVNRNQTGWYSCLASNEVNQERSDTVWLDIIYGPDEPVINITPYAVTEQGYSAVERDTVSLLCQAPSNPPSQYIWFYNNSQVFSGQQFTISKILRGHTGYYTCLAQNSFLNTRTKTTVTLTVYYLPDEKPACTILPADNYTHLCLWCSWLGGYPPASLRWIGPGERDLGAGSFSNLTQTRTGTETPNNTTFTCLPSHPALRSEASCNTSALLPQGAPRCFAVATRNNEYLMLSCGWEGGLPRALLWWSAGDGTVLGSSEEAANILVLKSSGVYSGKEFVCRGKHPLTVQSQECRFKLEAPVLVTQRSMVSVFEGSDVQLTCILKATYPASEIIWYNNQNQNVWDAPQKYLLQREAAWSNLTVRETDGNHDGGEYWCAATNAVGGAQIPITLNVKKYPSPPNVTISKLLYSRQRTEVELEWMTRGSGDLTGFIVERQVARKSSPSSGTDPADKQDRAPSWETVAGQIDPDVRGHKLSGLDPTTLYAFRIMAVNHRTMGHPSEVKTPADPPFNAYPAVIGAAVAGMIVAAVGTMLVFQYIIRNRDNNPRLHDMFFGIQPAESRENISNPEDEWGAMGSEDGGEPTPQNTEGAVATDSADPTPSAEAPPQPPPPGDENEPVNVTITVTATG
ncbi:V-set and immunoglobulin domain-containing protein 10-like 2 [Acipenser ruthenus]|uniref:V-set and immunoglobulin domain-containing protein 10-like 2 n=1 Tax=Acipenser ruthenus TaxID=7906 RepID=UPI0027417270|nr:V-set and immunoglobulin domain-containing protein 10-like 2 [Acipenser ruthenus]